MIPLMPQSDILRKATILPLTILLEEEEAG
jgi:hypothetical protein